MKIDGDGKPFAIILWADTAKLSTSGTQKGHFIVARAGNLPQFIRNGDSIGGGRIVGFVPLVSKRFHVSSQYIHGAADRA